jgi:RimJ/RimL family protein N-acetyltransferase
VAVTAATGDNSEVEAPPVRIDIDGLVLRRERRGDEVVVAQAVAANLEHLRPWMPWAVPEAATVQAQRERVINVEQWWDEGSLYNFLLLDEPEQSLLGVFGLHRRIGPGGLELGYWLDRRATGHGYATAAAQALTDAALRLDDVSRVEIHCDEANERSQRVPNRLGYRLDRIEADTIEAPAEVGRSMIWVYPPHDAPPAR